MKYKFLLLSALIFSFISCSYLEEQQEDNELLFSEISAYGPGDGMGTRDKDKDREERDEE